MTMWPFSQSQKEQTDPIKLRLEIAEFERKEAEAKKAFHAARDAHLQAAKSEPSRTKSVEIDKARREVQVAAEEYHALNRCVTDAHRVLSLVETEQMRQQRKRDWQNAQLLAGELREEVLQLNTKMDETVSQLLQIFEKGERIHNLAPFGPDYEDSPYSRSHMMCAFHVALSRCGILRDCLALDDKQLEEHPAFSPFEQGTIQPQYRLTEKEND